jgi:hypothetical protein
MAKVAAADTAERKKRPRGRPKARLIEEALGDYLKTDAKGVDTLSSLLESVRLNWTDLEKLALAFVQRGVDLLPGIAKASEALSCAQALMSIRRTQAELERIITTTLVVAQQPMRFATPEELQIDLAAQYAESEALDRYGDLQ